MKISKIVITGGPCGGKSTAISRVQSAFSQLGYTVLSVPETATELITAGIAPWTCKTNAEFQKCLLKLQLEKENVFLQAAEAMSSEKVLIVCDRGAIDNKAYMNDSEFAEALAFVNIPEKTLRESYDAVFHLVTTAKGAEKFYTTSNNSARTETPEQASLLDDKLISVWEGHPYLRIIENISGFEDKIQMLITELALFLGEAGPCCSV